MAGTLMATSAAISPLEAPEKSELTTKQVLAVAALIEGYSWHESAEKAQCSYASIKRWFAQPNFKAAIADGQREALAAAAGKLASGCKLAVDVLIAIAGNPGSQDSVRVRASEVILTSAIKAYELGELQRKIEALEGLLNEQT